VKPLNNGYPTSQQVAEYKSKYKVGTRIRLINMINEKSYQAGDTGTVKHVDDMGQIHMSWDGGGSLALIPEVDEFEIISEGADTNEAI